MLKISVAAFALIVSTAISGSASAAERGYDGERHAKHSYDRDVNIRSTRHPAKESWAGYRTDFAGNSYFYYKPGAGSPFGPGKGLRPPYPN